jgi:anti-sigma factor RsiW
MRRSRHLAADDRDAVMEAERDAQAIVARTEIGSARRNTNGDLLHSYAADTRPLARPRERDRGSVAMPRFPATHPLCHADFELSRWSIEAK